MRFILALVLLYSVHGAAVSLKAENRKVDITPHAVTWVDGHGELWAYIPGLSDDLFKTLKTAPSRGPKWGDKALEYLESKHDFSESSSYWYDRHDAEKACGFTEEEAMEAADSYELTWVAVKPLHGSKNPKSIMYLVQYYTILEGPTECRLFEDEYVFLNELDKKGEPIYLGIRAEYPPEF